MDKKLKKREYIITEDRVVPNPKWAAPAVIQDEIDTLMTAVKAGKKPRARLEQLIAKYPNVVVLWNLLQLCYENEGNLDMVHKLTDEMLVLFPGYLFAVTAKANQFLKMGKLDAVKELLGQSMDIGALYPHREIFHISEYRTFAMVAVEYLARTYRFEEADQKIGALRNMEVDEKVIKRLEKILFHYISEKILNDFKQQEENEIRAETTEEFTLPQREYIFHALHPDLQFLYCKQWAVNSVSLQYFIENKKELLAAELCHIIDHAIEGYENMKKHDIRSPCALHALAIFPYIDDELAFTYLLKLMHEPYRCWDYWSLGWEKYLLPSYFKRISENKLRQIVHFIKEKGGNVLAKSSLICYTSLFLAYSPGAKEEVVGLLGDLFKFFQANRNEETLFDTRIINVLVSTAADIRAVALLEIIKECYEAGWVMGKLVGNYEAVREEMTTPKQDNTSLFPKDVFEHLSRLKKMAMLSKGKKQEDKTLLSEEFLGILNGNYPEKIIKENPETGAEYHFNKAVKEAHAAKPENKPANKNIYASVSRNALCYCGSGKKYKRCHGK